MRRDGGELLEVAAPTSDELKEADCWEPKTDVVRDDEPTTAFKQAARLHQARWRQSQGMPPGTSPYDPAAPDTLPPSGKPRRPPRTIGSRLEYAFAVQTKANLISGAARAAADTRLSHPQKHEMINRPRLWCDLLSSMPMCINLFGPLAEDVDLARQVIPAWFPDAPGTVDKVVIEWSPGRRDESYLGNQSAFDAAIIMDLGGNRRGIIGVETKYHEHLKAEAPPSKQRLSRYKKISEVSAAFHPESVDALVGRPLQQIWQDHLLALSMPLHPGGQWQWAKFVVVYPGRNPSFAQGVKDYAALLARPDTFGLVSLEDILDSEGPLPEDLREPLRRRYLW